MQARENLLFTIASMAAAATAFLELEMMQSQTPAVYGEMLRWMHVSVATIAVALVWFVYFYLRAGRRWLAWSITSLRLLVLVPNFLLYQNATFEEISSLRQVMFLGESFSIPIGEMNPWRLLTQLSSLLLVIFVTDAAVSAWKRGLRQRALVLGGTTFIAIVLAATFSNLMVKGILPGAFISLCFLLIVLAMAYELSMDLLQAHQLANDLDVSQQRMRLAARAADLGMWEWDIIRDRVWTSETGPSSPMAVDLQHLTIERYFELIHEDDREPTRHALKQALEGNGELRTELRLVGPGETIRWITVRGQVECDAKGKPLRMRGVSADITERKLAEFALLESEERFRQMADAAPVMIWMSGTDKLCYYFNKGWFDYTGRSLEQELGNGWAEGVHPDDFQRCLDIYTTSFDARRDFSMQYRLRKHDGEYGWILYTGVPNFSHDGLFLGYIGSCIDITSQKDATERVRESAEFNAKVLDSLHSQNAILNRNGTILAINHAWKAFALANSGTSSGVGVNYLEVCERAGAAGDATALRALAGIRSVLEGASEFFEMEYPCNSPSQFRSFLLRVVPLQTTGGGAVVSHMEITQLRRAEMEAATLQRELSHMQRVSTLGQLSSTLAHELNQPLGAILRNAEAGELFLMQDFPDIEEVQAILADIRRDDQRATAVIEHMRLLMKRHDLTLETLSVDDLIRQVAVLLQPELQERHLTLQVEAPPALPNVRGDRVHLQQVILNLLINSMDALDGHPIGQGQVTIRASKSSDGMVELAVIDRGAGIEPDKLLRIFEPFETTKAKGTGIGLAISKRIIGSHGGRIWAENNPDGGATVRFTLRVAQQEDRA